MKIFTR